jgi:hypothetical protein
MQSKARQGNVTEPQAGELAIHTQFTSSDKKKGVTRVEERKGGVTRGQHALIKQ